MPLPALARLRRSVFSGLLVALGAAAFGQTTDRYTVCFFLLEDCKITQAYADRFVYFYQTFSSDSIRFAGYFPSPVSEDAAVRAFADKYALPFPYTRQGAYDTAKRFGVTVTPEVVVYNETRDSVYYQGRIDNRFERVGQRRQVVTSHELEAALNAIQRNKPVPIPRTNAVGCFLN
jgi:hypothetical protein